MTDELGVVRGVVWGGDWGRDEGEREGKEAVAVESSSNALFVKGQ
jgi:hypothetical protein